MAKLPLCDGHDVPQLCLVSFRAETQGETKSAVRRAWQAGIRHFELSELFGNAFMVCDALREVHAERSELYLTLKLWPKARKPEDLIASCTTMLHEVGLEYVDLLLIHAPIDIENKTDQWKALEDLKDSGYCKSLGVANLTSLSLTEVLKNCRITPSVFEMEVTPFHQRQDLVEFCFDSSMVVLNNDPIAKGLRNNKANVQDLAEEAGVAVDVLLLRYAAARGFVVGIPERCIDLLGGDAEASILGTPLPEGVLRKLSCLDVGCGLSWVPPELSPEEAEEFLTRRD